MCAGIPFLTHSFATNLQPLDLPPSSLRIRLLERRILIDLPAEGGAEDLLASYSHLEAETAATDLEYRLSLTERETLHLQRDGDSCGEIAPGRLLAAFDDDLVVQLQLLRPDLLFQHAAVVSWKGRAVVFAAGTGSGKSTLCWALLHHGLDYMSDELGPIDPESLAVHPYSRAVCLKSPPPDPYALPGGVVRGTGTLHVPVSRLPRPPVREPLPLGAVFFPTWNAEHRVPSVRRLGIAESATRLCANGLNLLAHPEAGLQPTVEIARRVPAFELKTAELEASCGAVLETLDNLV